MPSTSSVAAPRPFPPRAFGPARAWLALLTAGCLGGMGIPARAQETELQVGVQNVLYKTPPFDAYRSPYYISSYGDARLATYTLTVRKNF